MTIHHRKATIYDIAQLSGASPSTVSAVLNGTWARRRIGQATFDTVMKIATEVGYSTNLQARGLRQAKSGLVGMIIPIHDNRFFSSLSQNFDTLARARGLCPVIASTLRSPKEERRVVETFIAYAVDALFIAGATDPEQLGALCAAANLQHIYIDLPGKDAPSVLTDNFDGAKRLTNRILSEMPKTRSRDDSKIYFLGGSVNDHATARRAEAFRAAVTEVTGNFHEDQIIQCGYAPSSAHKAIVDLLAKVGHMPDALFVNSFTAFEGVMSHFVTLPPNSFANSAIGCFDYDPFAAFLQFPVYMIRQNSKGLVEKAYELFDGGVTGTSIHEVAPDLVEPRTIVAQDLGDIG
jgi:LacI family transcriptional regulator, fructose operon transcriptional repressor